MPFNEFHYSPTGTGVISGKEVLEQTEDAINDLGTQISGDVQTAIDTANNALNTANTASADAQNAVNTANAANTAATNAQNTANAAQNTASNALTAAQNAQNDVNALGNRVTTAENNISQNTTDISGLTTRMGTAEGNITTLQNDVVTAQGTATSAQITANLAREQAYVLRYASSAVTPNSTIAYTVLNNTDNVKMGDSLIDASGQVFLIVSVDSVNETVTVSALLLTLALDANVVHTSGNETVSGAKTFSEDVTIYNSDVNSSVKSLNIKNQNWVTGEISGTTQSNILFVDKNGLVPVSFIASKGINGESYLRQLVRTKDNNNNTITEELYFYISKNGSVILRPWHNDTIYLGTESQKWKDVQTYLINGLNPGALGMPNDTSIDIAAYVTDLSGGSNQYVAPANGIVSVDISSTNRYVLYNNNLGIGDRLSGSNFRRAAIIPVRKNDTVIIQSDGGTLNYAKFYPCLGNV